MKNENMAVYRQKYFIIFLVLILESECTGGQNQEVATDPPMTEFRWLKSQVEELNERISVEQAGRIRLEQANGQLNVQIENLNQKIFSEQGERTRLETETTQLNSTLRRMQDEMNKGTHETKCESGFLHSDLCFPTFSKTCFNKRKRAGFSLNFTEPPVVSLGFLGLDLLSNYNTRIKVYSPVVTKKEVSVQFDCWEDSVCYEAYLSWMACGTVQI